MGLLAKCVRCGNLIVPGAPCPECRYTEGEERPEFAEEQRERMAEYVRRKQMHVKHYTIYMVLAFALGLNSLVLLPFVYRFKWSLRISLELILLCITWLVLAGLFAVSKRIWPIGLCCPHCEVRLDHLDAESAEHCPGCNAKLH